MGAIFFYIFIYFIGYYGSNVLNILTVRPLVTNRYIFALLPVYIVAFTHAYMLVSSPPPQGKNITVEYALLEFVVLPVIVVTLSAIYFLWNSKGIQKDSVDEENPENTKEESEQMIAAEIPRDEHANIQKTDNQTTDINNRS